MGYDRKMKIENTGNVNKNAEFQITAKGKEQKG